MSHLVLILLSLALIGAFFAVTDYEMRRGARFFAPARARLDERIERVIFIVTHVDFGAFVQDEARRLIGRASHDLAHLSLQFVRATERLLTRLVRSLRARYAGAAAPNGEKTRTFIKTLADFKVRLKETAPDNIEVR